MGRTTRIEWCDSTVNPTAGCDGCELWTDDVRACYAGRLHTRFAGKNLAYAMPFKQPMPMPGRMARAASWSDLRGKSRPDKPHLDGLPRIIFIGDMADVFSTAISDDYIDEEIVKTVESEAGRRHFWVLLTKRPGRAGRLVDRRYDLFGDEWPGNLMLMASVTAASTMSRLDEVLGACCDEVGLSIEPMLSPIPLQAHLGHFLANILWVIIGCESDGARCGRLSLSGAASEDDWLGWASELVGDCRAAGVLVFVKQIPQNGRVLRALHAFPPELRFREMPSLD